MTTSDDNSRDMEISLATALAKFADLYENFSQELQIWRDSFDTDLDAAWYEYFGEESPSFVRELDFTNLTVMERQLMILTLLMEMKIKELDGESGGDPFEIKEEVEKFRSKAELKLLHLYDKIKKLRGMLGGKLTGDVSKHGQESLISQTAKELPDILPKSLRGGDTFDTGVVSVSTPKRPGADALPPRLQDVINKAHEVTTLSVEEIIAKLEEFRRTFKSDLDITVRSSKGSWTLSLPYYQVPGDTGATVDILDVQRFIKVQQTAMKGTIDALDKSNGDPEKRRNLAFRLQQYLRLMYVNLRTKLSPGSRGILPYVGESIDEDLLLMIEAYLHLHDWRDSDDIRHYSDLFMDRIAGPVEKIISDAAGKKRYFRSILGSADQKQKNGF